MADITVMECPRCRSNLLMIRQKTGLERVRSFLTGMREYRCRDCDHKFRAPDRRRVPRDEKLPSSVNQNII
jgi:DNA-directed RNA polymerase subunit RPC12/RpoP